MLDRLDLNSESVEQVVSVGSGELGGTIRQKLLAFLFSLLLPLFFGRQQGLFLLFPFALVFTSLVGQVSVSF
jgi:hypothetical protein